MAVFMLNICKFNGCGITFPSLADLIQHIEDTHIDYDPRVIEQKEQQQPACLPLSYVLRFFTDAARKEALEAKKKTSMVCGTKTQPVGSVQSNTPTGSEKDEDEMSDSEDSNDSWTTPEESGSEIMIKYGNSAPVKKTSMFAKKLQTGAPNLSSMSGDKPFLCPVPGCKKKYKNVNGIKYHFKNGHKKEEKVRKAYKCPCGKSYKTSQGLKNHSVAQHGSGAAASTAASKGDFVQVPSQYDLQPVRTLTLKPLTSASLGSIKAIQGLVVAEPSDTGKKDSSLDTMAFSKGTHLQMTLPAFVTPSQKGLIMSKPESQTLAALGLLTATSSPHMAVVPEGTKALSPGLKGTLSAMASTKAVTFLPPALAAGAAADVVPL